MRVPLQLPSRLLTSSFICWRISPVNTEVIARNTWKGILTHSILYLCTTCWTYGSIVICHQPHGQCDILPASRGVSKNTCNWVGSLLFIAWASGRPYGPFLLSLGGVAVWLLLVLLPFATIPGRGVV